jgi:hypothetical protein
MHWRSFIINICLLSVCFLLFIQKSNALDASFIPNDENEPLPLSKKYRDSLRKLCVLLKTDSSRLPVEIAQKRTVLEKVCHKLAMDDNNIETASTFSKASRGQNLLYGLIGLGSSYYLWANRRWLITKIKIAANRPQQLQRGQVVGYGNNVVASTDIPAISEGGTFSADLVDLSSPIIAVPVESPVVANSIKSPTSTDKVAEARSARLKRFAEMNNVNTL